MKLLVLGGSGLIGHAIVKKSKNEFDVLTTYYRNSVAIDNHGNEVSSGIYIYQLNTQTGVYSSRMILMR